MPGRPHLRRHRRRPSPARAAGVVALALLALLTGGCGSSGGGVHVDRFDVTAAGHEGCRALLSALPDHVDDRSSRRVTGSTYAAAWGDPAIVLRCGVGRPDGFDKFSRCQRANGVDWFVPESVIADQGADAVMTTIGRSPAVEVTVPARYRPAGSAAAMVDLATVIKAHTRVTSPCV